MPVVDQISLAGRELRQAGSPAAAETIKVDANLDLLTTRSMQARFVGMNTFHKPFDDVHVRQTLNYAVNWDEIIGKLLNRYAYCNATSTGALTMGYDPNLKPYPYGPDKAKQLLADAGYPNGFDTELDGTIDRYNTDREVAEAIVGQLARVGVPAKYTGADFNGFFTRFLSDPALPMADGERALGPNGFRGLYFLGCGDSTGGDFDLCNRLHFHSQVRGIWGQTLAAGRPVHRDGVVGIHVRRPRTARRGWCAPRRSIEVDAWTTPRMTKPRRLSPPHSKPFAATAGI